VSAARHLVLIGLMGAGKTTVGERCAEVLTRPFVDTDALVVGAAGVPFDDLWAAEGESGFRRREAVAVADAAASPEALVIACGGGAVLDPENRRALRASGFVVWLQASPAVLAERLLDDRSRPLLASGDRTATLARLEGVRHAAYTEAAHATVETGGRSVSEVAAAVVADEGRAA
jgi:shikimate kinase